MGIIFAMWYVGGAGALPLGSNFPPGSKELLATVQYPNLTKICSVPTFFQRLIPLLRQENKDGFQALSRLKFVISTGAPCSSDICRELTEHGVNLIIAYGSTGKLEISSVSVCGMWGWFSTFRGWKRLFS